MRILVLHGPADAPASGERLDAEARELGVELSFGRTDDERAVADAIAAHGALVHGVLIGPALARDARAMRDAFTSMRVPVVEVPRADARYVAALRSMVEMLRHPDA